MEIENDAGEEKNKKDINQKEEKEKNPLDNQEKKIDPLNSDEFELKDHYSIDDISYSKFEMGIEDEENSILSHKKRKINNISQAILADNLDELTNILKNNDSLINKKTLDGFTFIQYAALNGSINCFKHLLSLKVKTDEDIEGFHLIHLSIMKSIFLKNKQKCLEMFKYIYQNLPEQKKLTDRLGRTFLHLIFELNFEEALEGLEIELDDLFIEDNNGEFALNYICRFNAEYCFWNIINKNNCLRNLYITARQKYKLSKNSDLCREEAFLENLFIYKNYEIIRILAINGLHIFQELYIDLNTIREKYGELINNDLRNNQQISNIKNIIDYINYTLGFLETLRQHANGLLYNVSQFDFPFKSPYFKTAIVYNKDCINHIKLPDKDPIKHFKKKNKIFENSDRLSCLINDDDGILLNNKIFNYGIDFTNYNIDYKYMFFDSKRKSCLNDILKCHDIKYIKALKYKSDNITKKKKNEKNETEKFWETVDLDLIEKNYFLYNDNDNNNENDTKDNSINLYKYEKIDIDTFISQYSYENIFNSTGCVFHAIDIIMEEGIVNNAFAIIRPPGHHSGYYGPVENKYGTSNGFCIVNNVAIGAAYAKYKYQDYIKKIAIVDIDVHHGNGTEEIIEMLNYKNFTKPFNYEKICGVKITEKQNINWLDFDDAKNVLFISTHIYDKNNPDKFYPYSGSQEKNTKKDSEIYPGGIYNIPFEYKENYPYEYRNILRSKIIPRLYKFKPDLIFISAGFDGHQLETINQKHMLLQEDDYGYIAQQLQFVANKFCKGRMISVLEGGYNVNTGIISSFAQSIFNFTRYMNIGTNMLQCYDIKLTGHKREMQYKEEMELYNLRNITKVKPRRSERLKNNEEKENKKNKTGESTENNLENNKKDNIGNNKELRKEKEENKEDKNGKQDSKEDKKENENIKKDKKENEDNKEDKKNNEDNNKENNK